MMIYFKKLKLAKLNRGMTYVELIVVLGIFAMMTSIAMFNHGAFQSKVDIRNLASDIALKIVEAQRDAVGGKLPTSPTQPDTWKPSYGVYFNRADNKTFYRFVDLDIANKEFDIPLSGCPVGSECIEQVQIGKGNYVSDIAFVGSGCNTINTLHATFTRPNLTPTIVTNDVANCAYSGVEIKVLSPKGDTSTIVINTSGRIEIN
jgi:type II secretory pathway pseudopilin PulG